MLKCEPKSVTFNDVRLNHPHVTIIVTVRLFLAHYPNFDRGLRGQEDTIQLKSSFFEQKINTLFYLQNVTGRSRSISPARSGNTTPSRNSSHNRSDSSNTNSNSNSSTHSHSNSNSNSPKDKKVIGLLEGVVKELESRNPQLKEIIDRKMAIEKLVFEQKSEKV